MRVRLGCECAEPGAAVLRSGLRSPWSFYAQRSAHFTPFYGDPIPSFSQCDATPSTHPGRCSQGVTNLLSVDCGFYDTLWSGSIAELNGIGFLARECTATYLIRNAITSIS